MEQMIRCENGHYYDVKKHTSCPFCGVKDLGIEIQKTMAKKTGDFGGGINETRPLGGSQSQPDKGKTVGVFHKKMGIEPVTGWLVAISGPNKGQDYRIKPEKNFIGRSGKMDIQIHSDESVSRENHAAISYNPKSNSFSLYPGESKGLVYLSDEELLTPKSLKAFDVIEVGQTRLIFVPFCGEKFQWTEEQGEE